MTDQYVGEIRIMAFQFAPRGWAKCEGQVLPISQNTALFSLLGTFYGGDGRTTFALPNFQGTVPISQGQSPGTSNYSVGQRAGSQNVTLLQSEIPRHNHGFTVTTTVGTASASSGNQLAKGQVGNPITGATQIRVYSQGNPDVLMSPTVIQLSGGNLPHNNMMPYMALNFCIALQGIFPPRG